MPLEAPVTRAILLSSLAMLFPLRSRCRLASILRPISNRSKEGEQRCRRFSGRLQLAKAGKIGLPDIASGGEPTEPALPGDADEIRGLELAEVVRGGAGGDGELRCDNAAGGVHPRVDAAQHGEAIGVGEGAGAAVTLLFGEGRRWRHGGCDEGTPPGLQAATHGAGGECEGGGSGR